MRGPGQSCVSGGKTVISGRILPPFVLMHRCSRIAPNASSGRSRSRQSWICSMSQCSRPTQRPLLRHATRAPCSSSVGVCSYVPVRRICSLMCCSRPSVSQAVSFCSSCRNARASGSSVRSASRTVCPTPISPASSRLLWGRGPAARRAVRLLAQEPPEEPPSFPLRSRGGQPAQPAAVVVQRVQHVGLLRAHLLGEQLHDAPHLAGLQD